MDETEIARIAVDEGLLSSVELDRVRRDLSASGGSLLTVLEQAGLLRTADVERIRRERIGRSTTHIPGELVTTTHHRSIPDEARAAGLDPKSEFGRYTLVEKIGSGGMGAIWKSWDNVLGRWCALKLLHEEHGRHEDHRERFLREARAAARLAHPNIVQVYEVGQLGDQIFIALEYVPGETLRQRISHRATGPELRRRIELVRQSCEGIGAAHQAGITHRDVKPENVLVLPTPKGGQAKVADFGLAVDNTVVTRLTVAGDVFGTPAYMAPEQALGLQEIVGPATDVFAVGCILYEIVAGKLPFDADQAAASVYNTIHTDPPPLRKLAPKVHRDLETIIAKCLEKDPPRRYRDGRDLADDLGRYMAGEPILARPAGTIVRLARKARRNPALAFAIGAVLLLSASLTGILWYEQIARGESILRDLEQAQSLEEQAAKSPRLLTSAAARYQSVLREEPGNETALAGLARIAKILQAKESQDLEAQGVVTRRIAERDAQAARAALLDPLRLPGAGEICDLLVANHPGFPPSWELRAEYLWKTGRPSEALSDLVAVGEMGPESRNSRHLRVMCLVDLRRSLEAERRSANPTTSRAWNWRPCVCPRAGTARPARLCRASGRGPPSSI